MSENIINEMRQEALEKARKRLRTIGRNPEQMESFVDLKVVVEAMNLRPSDQLVYEIEADGRIILSAKTGTFSSVAARLSAKGAKGPARTVEDMNAAVKTMAVKRMSRTRS